MTALDLLSAFGDSALAPPTIDAHARLLTFTASAFCALVLLRVAAAASGRSLAVPGKSASDGDVTLLVRDGELQPDALARGVLCRDEVFAALRARGVYHLGEVARFYLEPSGSFALVKRPQPSPGLCIWPPAERSRLPEGDEDELSACGGCGHIVSDHADEPCEACGEIRRERVIR